MAIERPLKGFYNEIMTARIIFHIFMLTIALCDDYEDAEYIPEIISYDLNEDEKFSIMECYQHICIKWVDDGNDDQSTISGSEMSPEDFDSIY